MELGADISHHQPTFDAAAYRQSGRRWVALKVSESTGFVDSTFADRARRARGAGLYVVGYHFAHPGNPATAEAQHLISTATDLVDTWALDMEVSAAAAAAASGSVTSRRQDVPWTDADLDVARRARRQRVLDVTRWVTSPVAVPTSVWAWSDAWVKQVRQALGGVGVFYTYPFFWRDALGNAAALPGGALGWWARYAADPYAGLGWTVNGFEHPPACWQYTDGGSVPGIGTCDDNRMTDAAFAALFQGEVNDLGTFEGFGGSGQKIFQDAIRQVLNEGTAAGQTSFAGTVKEILTTAQLLVNEGRTQVGTITRAVADGADATQTAVLGYLAAHPGTVTLTDADKLDLAADIANATGLSPDNILDALNKRLEA